jgi:A/G-specific adenine glycosylase
LVEALLSWFTANARDLPWRRTRDPYAIWVSEIMLQQTQVSTVIPFWNRWLRALPTVADAAHASPDQLHKLWEGLGYYTRVRNLQKAAQVILDRHRGMFPEAFDDVLDLPGIGRYTAGAICSIAFNQPTPILDGNVMRVLTRIFGIAEDPKEKVTNHKLWQLAQALVLDAAQRPPMSAKSKTKSQAEHRSCSQLNQALMELGALVCTPRNPQCAVCPAQRLCVAFREDRVADLPRLVRRAPATARHFVAFALERDGKFLVRQRPAGVVNAHLWEFPNAETHDADISPNKLFASIFGFTPSTLPPLITIKHSITRYRITLEAFRVPHPADCDLPVDGIWKNLTQLHALAFTSAHRKVLRSLGTPAKQPLPRRD